MKTATMSPEGYRSSMDSNLRTIVTFTSAVFNSTEQKPYFINPCCFGDDVARWLIEQFRERGIAADEEPGQEDFGWYVTLRTNDIAHWFLFSFRPSDGIDDGKWIGFVERCGFIRGLLGRGATTVDRSAVDTIHRILTTSSNIENVRWHLRRDFDRGNEAAGQPAP
jgi:hypothetical protein